LAETAKSKENKAISTYSEASVSEIDKAIERFQPESYLYMDGVPESPRFLLNLEQIFKNIIDGTSTLPSSSSTIPKPIVKKEKASTKTIVPVTTETSKPIENSVSTVPVEVSKSSGVLPINKFSKLIEILKPKIKIGRAHV
jgi:hypothetical protein